MSEEATMEKKPNLRPSSSVSLPHSAKSHKSSTSLAPSSDKREVKANKNGRSNPGAGRREVQQVFSTPYNAQGGKGLEPGQGSYYKGRKPHPRSSVPYNLSGTRGDRGGVRNKVAEVGSVSRPGSRKGGVERDSFTSYKRGDGRKRTDDFYGGYHRQRQNSACYNKELFLQANCQFVVSDLLSFNQHLLNPDLPVDWSCVEELRLMVEEPLNCPICLYPPYAGKISRCGHVFCWSCVLHYLSLSDHTWRKCPICYESIYANQLKSVVGTVIERQLKAGDPNPVRMRLMRREKGSTQALPVTSWEKSHSELAHLGEQELSRFAKLLVVTKEEVVGVIVAREREELETQLAVDGDQPESVFIRLALDHLNEREECVQRAQMMQEVMSSPACMSLEQSGGSKAEGLCIAATLEGPSKKATFYVDALNEVSDQFESDMANMKLDADQLVPEKTMGGDRESEERVEDRGSVSPKEDVAEEDEKPSYYFYQVDDGQLVFLHPLCAKALMMEYGSLERAPKEIEGKILQMERMSMTEGLRLRFRYLSHLPLTTNFVLAELKLTSDLLSKKTYNAFADEFRKREKARTQRAKEEARRDRTAQQWERALLLDPGNYSNMAAASRGECEVPDIPFITYVQSAQREIDTGAESVSPPAEGSPPVGSPDNNSPPSFPSFAQMLKSGKPKVAWGGAMASPQGDAAVCPSEVDPVVRVMENEDGERIAATSFGDAFGDAIQAAFNTAQTKKEGDKAQNKKKKKNKGTVIFSM